MARLTVPTPNNGRHTTSLGTTAGAAISCIPCVSCTGSTVCPPPSAARKPSTRWLGCGSGAGRGGRAVSTHLLGISPINCTEVLENVGLWRPQEWTHARVATHADGHPFNPGRSTLAVQPRPFCQAKATHPGHSAMSHRARTSSTSPCQKPRCISAWWVLPVLLQHPAALCRA